jgi:hypothetical protein
MKRYPKDFKQYVNDLITYCRNETCHGIYHYKIEWHTEHLDADPCINAQVWIDHVYLAFEIKIGPNIFEMWKNKNYKEMGRVMMHEVCHLFFHQLAKVGKDSADTLRHEAIDEIKERQTQTLSVVIASLLPKNWFTPDHIARYMATLK